MYHFGRRYISEKRSDGPRSVCVGKQWVKAFQRTPTQCRTAHHYDIQMTFVGQVDFDTFQDFGVRTFSPEA